MKRSVMAYIPVLSCVINDYLLREPGHTFLLRDLSRLQEIVDTRGESILFLDLPALGVIYDKALSTGFLDRCLVPKSFGKKSNGWPKLFGELILLSFNECGTIRQDLNPETVFFSRCIFYIFKKINLECSNEAVHQAVQDFVDIEQNSRPPSGGWNSGSGPLLRDRSISLSNLDGYREDGTRILSSSVLIHLTQVLADYFVSKFPALDVLGLVPRHGPGAVSDLKTGSDKYLFPVWPDRLEEVFPHAWFGYSSEEWCDFHTPLSNEYPAKLIAVPKTLKGPRLIASEPASLQYAQQALLIWLRENLPRPLRISIDFRSQEPSRDACRKASIRGDQATVDLSSASDRLSLWLFERIFRSHSGILEYVYATRSIFLTDGTTSGSFSLMKMKKMAAQGCGYTFPIQTIVYTIVSLACLLFEEGMTGDQFLKSRTKYRTVKSGLKRIRVFGDDIVMPSSCVPTLAHLLQDFGLKVNASKTHIGGFFRESCGLDAFRGYDVTPLYFRSLELSNPSSYASFVDVRNNAYEKGLWSLARYMDTFLSERYGRFLPTSTIPLGCVYRRSFLQQDPIVDRMRFNRKLFINEGLCLTVKNTVKRRRRDNPLSLLQYFLEDPPQDTFWCSGYVTRVSDHFKVRWVQLEALSGR